MRFQRQVAEPEKGGLPQGLGPPDDENGHFHPSGDVVREKQPGQHPGAKSEKSYSERAFPITTSQAKVAPRQDACPTQHQEGERKGHAFSKLARRRDLLRPGPWRVATFA